MKQKSRDDWLGPLSDRDKAVLIARLRGKTLKEIGKGLGVSAERIRQVEAKALRKVKGRVEALPVRDPCARCGHASFHHSPGVSGNAGYCGGCMNLCDFEASEARCPRCHESCAACGSEIRPPKGAAQ